MGHLLVSIYRVLQGLRWANPNGIVVSYDAPCFGGLHPRRVIEPEVLGG